MRALFLMTAVMTVGLFVACGDSGNDSSFSDGDGGTGGTSSGDPPGPFDAGLRPGDDAGCTGASCSVPPSCRAGTGSGIDTCGGESCCTTLPLPKTTTRSLDRYEITTGRLRAFVTAVANANGGQRNLRKWAKDYAAANPTSELGGLLTGYPGLLDVLPDSNATDVNTAVQLHLGGTPIDPINTLDGCFMSEGGYGHTTYWQPPEDLKPFKIGYGKPVDGTRKQPQSVLDAKPMNCVMPILLAAFCAWDGGELARAKDYREIWGTTSKKLTKVTVVVPWKEIVSWGDFNWANGVSARSCPLPGWPGCTNVQSPFYTKPAVADENARADDNTVSIGAPGDFPKDVTGITSANGKGWLDIGGNLMEAAWLDTPRNSTVKDVCATRLGAGTGPGLCTRRPTNDEDGAEDPEQQGTKIYTGNLPSIALIGYSFEGHSRRSEAYLASADGAETRIGNGDVKPVTFQYGKVGGRCVRPDAIIR